MSVPSHLWAQEEDNDDNDNDNDNEITHLPFREGKIVAKCDVTTDGRAVNCRIVSSTLPQKYVDSVLEFLYERARFQPEIKNGVPVVVHDFIYRFTFKS